MDRDNGIVIGVVSSLDDADGLGRVRVRYPYLDNQESSMARLVALMAGDNRGTFFKPEVEDEVLVAFEHGDPRRPYILGALWSKADPPPPDDGKPEKNNLRQIYSRSGHVLRFDDTDGAERIELIDKTANHKIVIDASGDKIEITCTQGSVEVKAPQGTVKVEAKTIEIKSSTTITLEATGAMTIKGSTVDIN